MTEMQKKVLVVDSDYFFVEFLSELLLKRGYEVLKAYNGKDGIARLEDNKVDILFADGSSIRISELTELKIAAFLRDALAVKTRLWLKAGVSKYPGDQGATLRGVVGEVFPVPALVRYRRAGHPQG